MNTPGQGRPDDASVAPVLADPVLVDAMLAYPALAEAVDNAVAGTDELTAGRTDRALGLDPHDFSGLYIRNRGSFALLAQRFLSDPRDVDEVLQEAFLRLFLALPELDSELVALAYCRRTVTNLCIDRYRADRRRPRLVELDEVEADQQDDASYVDPVLAAEDAAVVREALALLSPLHRAALVAREIDEKPLSQIAAELNVPEESVKHLLFRARRALRRLLVGTSVEPGAPLTGAEIGRLAHERLTRGMMRGAGVLIVMFVGVCTVALGMRPNTEGRGLDSGSVGATNGPTTAPGSEPATAPATRLPAPHVVAPIPPSSARNPQVVHPVTPRSTTAGTKARAHRSHPAKGHSTGSQHQKAPTPYSPSPSVQTVVAPYTLTGALRSTAVPTIAAAPATALTRVAPSGAVLTGARSVSYFLAPTTAGPLHLAQTLTTWSDGSASIDVAPVATTGGPADAVVQSVSISPDADGRVGADVSLVAPLDALGLPAAPIDMHIVYSADLSSVLLEHVDVSGPTDPSVLSAVPSVSNGDGQGSDAVEPLPATAPAVTREEVTGSSLTS